MNKVKSLRAHRVPVIKKFRDDGRVQEQFKDDCDINKIIAKYVRGEDISRYHRTVQFYGEEFPTSMSLTDAENIVARSREYFGQLPAEDRDFFKNDPTNFLKYLEDPSFTEDSYQRGYRIRPKQSAPVPSSPVDDTSSKPKSKPKAAEGDI